MQSMADVKDIDLRTGGGPPVPRNVYELVVDSAETGSTSNNDPKIDMWVSVIADYRGDPAHEGHSVPLTMKTGGFGGPKEAQMAKAKWRALGVNTNVDQGDQTIADSLIGRRFFAELTQEDASRYDENQQLVPVFEDMPGGGQRRAKRNKVGSMWDHNPKDPNAASQAAQQQGAPPGPPAYAQQHQQQAPQMAPPAQQAPPQYAQQGQQQPFYAQGAPQGQQYAQPPNFQPMGGPPPQYGAPAPGQYPAPPPMYGAPQGAPPQGAPPGQPPVKNRRGK